MGKKLKSLLAAVLLSFSSLFAVACSGSSSLTGIEMSNKEEMDVPFGNFSYDGVKVTLLYENGSNKEVDLEESMIPEIERLKFFKIGKQEVKVVYRTYFSTTMKINVVLNEFSDTYELVGYKCVYDGNPHEVKLNHELPEGAEVSFPKGYSFTNVGTYDVSAVIKKSGYATKTLEATLEIMPRTHDESGIVFEDKVVTYNGEPQTIEALNVPEGVTVNYTYWDSTHKININKVVHAGTYYVDAEFVNDNPNYKVIESRSKKLTIEKADYDLSGVEFPTILKEYDGQPYKPALVNPQALPHGLTAKCVVEDDEGHEIADCSSVGKYNMKAYISGGDTDHNEIKPLEATLTIAPEIIKIRDYTDFEGINVTFTGIAQYVDQPTLPTSASGLVNVTLNPSSGYTYVGEYPVVATFVADNPNQKTDLDSLTVYIIIQPANTTARIYDGPNPLDPDSYHDVSLEDISFDIAGNDYQVNGDICLSGEFQAMGYTVTPTTLRLYLITIQIDEETGEEEIIRTEKEIKDLTVGKTYEFSLDFELSNGVAEEKEELNESLIVNTLVGTFKYDTVKTLDAGGEYTKEFDASNIHICTDRENSTEKARVVNVESGVTAKSIKFYTDDTYTTEIVPDDFVLDSTYYYKVEFNQQESAIYVDATGSFTYKEAPFNIGLLSIEDGEASIVYDSSYVGDKLVIDNIFVSDHSTSEIVSLDDLEDGKEYDYYISFINKASTIWKESDGSFRYVRVKDKDSGQPISANNISICGNTASVININESIEVDSVKFYLGDGEVQPGSLEANNTYRYSITFKNDVGSGILFAHETGSIKIGGRVSVKGATGEYDSSFSLANLIIKHTSATDPTLTATVVGLNPINTVKSINFYDNDNNPVNVTSLTPGETYTYEVLFDSTDDINWIGERGSFLYQKVQDTSGETPKDLDATNIILRSDSASLSGIDYDIAVDSIKFYDGITEINVNEFVPGNSYNYLITFKNGTNKVYVQEMGLITYGGTVKVEGTTPGTYDAPFTLSNLVIGYNNITDAQLITYIVGQNPINTVKSITIYNINGEVVSDLKNLEFEQSYTYVILFDNYNDSNWTAEVGTFTYSKVMNSNGVLDFNVNTNLKIEGGVASLVNITEGAEVKSITIFDNATKEVITDLNTLENGKTYAYQIKFNNKDSKIWDEKIGTFVYPTDA